jgi:hypothetical protein
MIQKNLEPVEKMKVNSFPITQQRNGWLISWPGFRNISRVENKQKLADLIFDSIGAQEARFGVRFKDGETKFLHIRSVDWHAPGADCLDYLFFVHDRHNGNKLAATQYLQWEQNLVSQLDQQERSSFKI